MKNPLHKRLPRELKQNAGKYIGILCILMLTIIIGSSFMVTMDSAIVTLEKNDKECNIEDGQFEVATPLSVNAIDAIKEKGITIVSNFYSTDNDYDGAKVIIFNQRSELNIPSVFEGKMPNAENEVAIERLFAKNREIEIGDKLVLNGKEYIVTATIAIPDYSSLFKNNQDLLMNTRDFGIVIATKEGFGKMNEDTLTYRYSYKFNDELENSEEISLIEEMQKILLSDNANLQNYLTAKNNQSISFFRNDVGKDGPVMKVFVYLLILIIAFVFAVLTSNTIEAESGIIGTLRAMGYKKSEIIMHYLSPTIIIAIISSIVGNLIGYTLMIEPFKELYYGTYSIAPLDIQFNAEALITTTIVPIFIMIFINWWMLYSKLSLSPIKFIRKELHKKKQKKAVKLPDFKFITRFRMRVLIQNKLSYIILFIGIFISSFLLMFGMGLDPLIDNYVDEIDDSVTYDYQYILKLPIEIENAEKLQIYNLKTWFELGQMDMRVSFMGISDKTEFFDTITLQENVNEITISKPLADKLNLEVGDEVEFKDEYYEKEYTLKISNISDYKGTLTVFMKMELLNELLGNDVNEFNAYISNEKLDIEEAYVAKYITRADMVSSAKEMMKSFEGVLEIVNIFSIIIYMILMYILTKTVIEKNVIPISYMKVFGYNGGEIRKLYLNATTITVVISLLVCIPIEAMCFKYVLVYIGSMIEGHIPFYLPMWLYGAIIAIGIGAYFVINALHIRKISKIQMSEALKNRE